MSIPIPPLLLQHTVTIDPYAGTDSWGQPVYGTPVVVRCFVVEQRQLVRAADGDEVVSESTVIAPAGTVVPANSRVTLPSGRVARVITAKHHDGGTLPVPSHVEINLT